MYDVYEWSTQEWTVKCEHYDFRLCASDLDESAKQISISTATGYRPPLFTLTVYTEAWQLVVRLASTLSLDHRLADEVEAEIKALTVSRYKSRRPRFFSSPPFSSFFFILAFHSFHTASQQICIPLYSQAFLSLHLSFQRRFTHRHHLKSRFQRDSQSQTVLASPIWRRSFTLSIPPRGEWRFFLPSSIVNHMLNSLFSI